MIATEKSSDQSIIEQLSQKLKKLVSKEEKVTDEKQSIIQDQVKKTTPSKKTSSPIEDLSKVTPSETVEPTKIPETYFADNTIRVSVQKLDKLFQQVEELLNLKLASLQQSNDLKHIEKIIQQWYFGDHPEESLVTIKLHPHAQGTSVELKHVNIPDEDYDDIVEGWNTEYFASLHDFYA